MHAAGAGSLFDRPCARDYEIDCAEVAEWTESRLCLRSGGRDHSTAIGVSSLEKVRAHPEEYSPAEAAAGEHAQNESFTIGALQSVDLCKFGLSRYLQGISAECLVPEARLTKLQSTKKFPEFEPKVLSLHAMTCVSYATQSQGLICVCAPPSLLKQWIFSVCTSERATPP